MELPLSRDLSQLFQATIWGAVKCRFQLRDSPGKTPLRRASEGVQADAVDLPDQHRATD